MTSLFVSDRDLSGDLVNHYQVYAQAKERLRRNVAAQEEEFHKATSLVMTDLALQPGTEHRRLEVARAVLERCLDKGPESPIAVADDERGVLEALAAFVPAPAVVIHCESLKKRAAALAANARKLSADAQALAGRTTLLGECTYTRRD